MSEVERQLKLAYAAGIVDGEGSVGIYKNNFCNQYQLRITVEMTREERKAYEKATHCQRRKLLG